MKKIFLLLMLLVPAMTFAGCSDGNDDPQTEIPDVPDNPGGDDNDDDEPDPANPGNGKILIAYFSRWGNTNYPADVDASTGASIIINNGNRRGTTQVVADYIQTAVGGDVHLIETSAPYPVDFDDVRDLNHSEQENGTRPALKSRIGNMAQYKTVFIGYPVWATTVPQAIRLVPRIIRLRGENGRTVLHARRIRGRQQLSRRTGCGVRCNRDGRSRVAGLRTCRPRNPVSGSGSNGSASNAKSRREPQSVSQPEDAHSRANGSIRRLPARFGRCFR